ncbi:MAG: DUF3311 domain-containing protein [Nitrososphaerota archaeon]|nr:DUF3311 domain-containing protein [Nitrososphaerota archaeon]
MRSSTSFLALVVVVIFAAYAWPWYNFVQPALLGAPFFYWWVIVWYVIATFLLVTYALMSESRDAGEKQ